MLLDVESDLDFAKSLNGSADPQRSLLVLAARDGLIDRIPYVELFEENNERDRIATPKNFRQFWNSPMNTSRRFYSVFGIRE